MVRVASRKALIVSAVALAATALMPISAPSAMEFFQPYGSTDHLGADREPHLNSAQDRFNEQADIYQSEINRSQRERAYWDTYMRDNLLDHDHTQELPYARDY